MHKQQTRCSCNPILRSKPGGLKRRLSSGRNRRHFSATRDPRNRFRFSVSGRLLRQNPDRRTVVITQIGYVTISGGAFHFLTTRRRQKKIEGENRAPSSNLIIYFLRGWEEGGLAECLLVGPTVCLIETVRLLYRRNAVYICIWPPAPVPLGQLSRGRHMKRCSGGASELERRAAPPPV